MKYRCVTIQFPCNSLLFLLSTLNLRFQLIKLKKCRQCLVYMNKPIIVLHLVTFDVFFVYTKHSWHWFSTLHLLLEHSDSYCPTTSTFRTSFLTYSFRSFAARAITISNTRHKQIDLLVCCYIVWSRITCFNCWELRRSKEHYLSGCVNT